MSYSLTLSHVGIHVVDIGRMTEFYTRVLRFVVSDRGTTSQNDIDHGRVVVVIDFVPQLAIERLRVTLALAEDGGVQWTDSAALAEVSP